MFHDDAADGHDIPELTPLERTRWGIVSGAIEDAAEAIHTTGDAEGLQAAVNQVRQVEVDTGRYRDALHVPDDAGEYEEALVRMMRRIPDRWGRWISVSRGWYRLVTELDAALARIDPGYELLQVKQKFGTLRYHTRRSDGGRINDEQWRDLVREAEERSATTCELCGADAAGTSVAGDSATPFTWVKTLCSTCRSEHQHRTLGRYRPGRR